MAIAQEIAAYLPYLRRYARALCGSQDSGDAYVRTVLEALLADPTIYDREAPPRVALYKLFKTVWTSTQGPSDADAGSSASVIEDELRLERLTPRSRQALLLTTLEEFSTPEAGLILECEAGEIDTLVAMALEEISDLAPSRVMIIEDEAMIALDIEDIVKGLGHSVTGIATTRDEAVALAEKEQPDLVLADIQLADGSSGIDAVNDILKAFDVPVIFITAYPDRLLTGERPEPTFLITKPFLAETVRSTISQALFFKAPNDQAAA